MTHKKGQEMTDSGTGFDGNRKNLAPWQVLIHEGPKECTVTSGGTEDSVVSAELNHRQLHMSVPLQNFGKTGQLTGLAGPIFQCLVS